MATVYLRPHSPLFVRGGHTYTRSTGQCHTNMKNVVVWRARQRHISGQRVGCGWVWGGLTGRMRHAGGTASWGWAAEGAPRQYMKRRHV
eukprot:scaffold78702_cov55-Phaeocystis_antarctica.AAC.2